jgi:hypothetical protein
MAMNMELGGEKVKLSSQAVRTASSKVAMSAPNRPS